MKRNVQLYIAGQLVDLGDDSWILYNWTREEMSNPTAVINSSSHQVTLPGTCRNNGVFGAAFRLDRRTLFGIRYDGTEFDPTRKTPFMLYDADGTVLESGYCRLDAVNTHNRRHAYTVTLYGGLGSFFYALASKDDGTPRTLADLIWADMDGEDVTDFEVFPGADTVQDAWTYLGGGEPERKTWWNVLNFAPCYNGLPADFDASHAISNHEAYNNVPQGEYVENNTVYYSYKAGLDCALLSFTNPHTEWEMADLRWYLQRPVVSVKAFIAAVCDPRNNGGYEVTLDPTFFNATNPYYADAWWTLGMIATDDRASSDCLNNVLRASKTPMRYLADFAKHFGLVFMWDSSRHKVSIVTRATFYADSEIVHTQREEYVDVPVSATTGQYMSFASLNPESGSLYEWAEFAVQPGEKYNITGWNLNANIPLAFVRKAGTSTKARAIYKGTSDRMTGEYTIPEGYDTLYVNGRTNASPVKVQKWSTIEDVTVTRQKNIDLTGRIDRSQEIVTDPVLADKRWYQLGDGGKGEFAEQYKSGYGKGYGTQRIDTGYEFDAGTTVLTDGLTFQDAAEVDEGSLLFASAYGVHGWGVEDVLLIPNYEEVTIELWNGADTRSSRVYFFDWFSNTTPTIAPDVPEHPGLDWLPKVQLHGAEGKAQDGADVLLFFGGILPTPTVVNDIRKPYYLTDDSDAMTDLAGGPCWDLTRTGIQRTSLPSFRRNVLSGRYIVNSWEWGASAVRPVPDIQFPDGAPTALYDLWWKAYLADRYATDTAVMTCRVDLRGLPVGQALLRRFYWYDGALWTLNAIRNHPLTSYDLTECEFVRVQDKLAYTEGPGSLSAHFLDITPSAASFQVKSRGEVLTLTVRSSSAWTLDFSAIQNWLVASAASGSAGTTVITLTAVGNDSSARRSVGVTVTNTDGITRQFNVIQPPKTAGSLSLSPSSLTINSGGTGLRGASSRVTADGAWAVDETTVESWLRLAQSSAGITVYCDGNGGSARSSYIKVYLTGDPDTYAILAVTQEAGAGGTGGITLTDGQGNISATVQATGGSLTLVLTVPEGDDWTLTPSENWVSVSPASGSGDNSQIAVTIPSYSGSSDRQATITAKRDGYTEGAVFYIIQAAPAANPDYINLTRADAPIFNNVEIDGNGGAGFAFDVRASGGWSVSAQNSWIHPLTQYGAWSGNGNATLWFSCDANSGSPRTGTIVGTHATTGETSTFYVYQSGDGTVSLSASFNYSTIDSTAQVVYLTVVCPSGLAWSIDNVSSGLTPETYSGTGPDTIAVSVAAYTGGSQRTLSLRVKNTMYSLTSTASVKQNPPAASDYLRVTPFGTVNVGSVVTYQDFAVECSTSWKCETSASGVTITPSTGSGNGTVRVTFGANQSTDPRTIPVAFSTTNGSGKTAGASVVQAGASSQSIAVTPSALNLPGGASSGTVGVTATGAWSASKSASWITLSQSSGSAGSGIQITVSAAANTGGARTGRVTFTCGSASAVLTVNQGGVTSVDSIDALPASVTLGAESGTTGATTVYASGAWKIADSTPLPSWLAASGPQAGNLQGETLSFSSKSANGSAVPRTANLRLELRSDSSVYKMIAVSQEGQVILYASPASVSVFAFQGAGVTDITCNTDWQVLSHSEDIVIEDGTESGSGNGQVSWFAKGNPSSSARTLQIVVETTDHTRTATVYITQAASVLSVSDTELTLAGNGDSVPLYVQASDPWSILASTIPSWLSVTPSAGTQSFNELVVAAGTNPNTFDRSATLTVQNTGGKTVYVTVTQKGSGSGTLTVSPATVTLPSSAGTSGSLTVVASGAWYIEQNDELMVEESSGGAGSKTMAWQIGANTGEEWREVVITVRSQDGALVARQSIWQPGSDPDAVTFLPDTDALTFYADAAAVTKTYKMRVVSGRAWTANGDVNWIGANKSSGAADTVVEVTFTPTISSSAVRIGHWTVTNAGGVTRTLTITTIPD